MPALSALGGDGGNRTRVRGTRPQTSTSLVGPSASPPGRRCRPRYTWNQPMGTEVPTWASLSASGRRTPTFMTPIPDPLVRGLGGRDRLRGQLLRLG